MIRGLIVALVAGVALAADAAAQPLDRDAISACAEFMRIGRRLADGATTSVHQVDAELRSAYRMAERSPDRELQQKIGAAIRGGKREVNEVYDHCANMVRTPSRPLTQQEIEQQTRRAGEQSGSSKCVTKSYGGGAAVTVCD